MPNSFYLLMVVGMVVLILGSLFLVYLTNKLSKGLVRSTHAVVTEARARTTTRRRDNRTRRVTVHYAHYEYTVDGVTYTGFGRLKGRKKEGKKVKIYYNPKNPEINETAAQVNKYRNIVIFIGIILVPWVILFMLKLSS